ncbi:MAG: hypothetical protein K8R21_10790 [Leptospira sp.]|nr:hypothetical protein [Leptospira sp.]
MNRKFFSFFAIFLVSISVSGKEEKWISDRLIIREYPDNVTRIIPREFIPEGSVLLKSTDFRGAFSEITEASLILYHPMKLSELEAYYNFVFKALEWKILQKEILRDKKELFLAEGPGRKIITLHIIDEITQRKIKIILRKNSVF